MAAKQYNHKALSEAIRQGQARMKRLMQNTRVEPAIPEPQVPKQPEKKPVPVGIRPVPAERETPYRLNQGTLVATGAFVLVIAFLVWVNRSKERMETQPVPKPTTPAPAAPAPSQTAQTPPSQPAPTPKPAAPTSVPPVVPETKPTQTSPAVAEPPKPASAEKDHIIVIATYANREHLVPVQAHFENNGIKTEIMRRGSYYLLVTKDRFDSPLKPGTDGYQMLNKIKSVGTQYKAPDGFENFGRTPFQDAYGMKVKAN